MAFVKEQDTLNRAKDILPLQHKKDNPSWILILSPMVILELLNKISCMSANSGGKNATVVLH